MMKDDGAGGRQQERAEGNGVDEGQQTTTDQQSTVDGSGKEGSWGYSCEGKGCIGGEWGVPPLRGPWWQQKSWCQWQGGGRQQTTVAEAVKQQSTKSDSGKQWH